MTSAISQQTAEPPSAQIQSLGNIQNIQVTFTEEEQRWLAKDHTVRVRIGKAPPYSFFKEEPLGISGDYLNAVAQRAGFQVKYFPDIPWPDALKHIKNRKKIDLLPALTKTLDRKEHIVFTQNYLTSPRVIYTREDSGFVDSLEDLSNKTISVERGYFLQQKLSDEYPNIKLLIKETTEEALESLSLGEADAYVGNLTAGTYIIKMKGFNNIKIAAPAPFGNLTLAMGVRNDWPELASIINKVLATFNHKEHVAIRDKWVAPIRYEYGISTADILKWVLGISSIALAIIITILIWNKKLAKEITARKKVEQEIRGINESYNRITDNADEAIFKIKLEEKGGIVVYMNPTAERLFGYTMEDWQNPELGFDIIHPDYSEKHRQILTEIRNSKKPIKNAVLGWIAKDGRKVIMEYTIIPITDKEGEITYFESIGRDITERKLAEQELFESENRYRSLVELSPEAVFVHQKGKILFINQEGAAIFGAESPEELVGHSWTHLIHPEYYEAVKARIEQIYNKKETLPRAELKYIRLDGKTIDVEASGTFINYLGKPAVLSVIRDITLGKQAEKALDESTDKLLKAQQVARMGFLNWNLKTNDITWSDQITEIYGMDPNEDQTLEYIMKFVHPDDRDLTEENLKMAIDGVKDYNIDHRILRSDGAVIWVQAQAQLVRDYGNPEYLLGTVIDITKRKLAEEELQIRIDLNQTLLDTLPCVALLLKPSTREIVASNKAGREAGAIPGTTCYGTWGQRTDPCPWCLAPKVWEKGEPQHMEIGAVGVFWDAHWFPIDEDLYLHYAFDISERKKMEDQLQQAQKMEAIGTLAGGIAHDFNNILSPIMIHSEMAKMELAPDSPAQHNLRQICKAGERARDMVKQILTFSRKKEGERVEIKIIPVLKEVLKLLRSTMPTTIDIQQNLEAEPDTVLADPTQIHQIMLNLGTNASHAMREKGGTLKVSLVKEDLDSEASALYSDLNPGPYLKLTVSDTGSGIDDETMEKVFEPYFTTKGIGEGTGMGLALIHGIVKSYGGDITVESKPGTGTTFNVYLPRVEADVSAVEGPLVQFQRGAERILFVDDEKVTVDAIQPMLVSGAVKML